MDTARAIAQRYAEVVVAPEFEAGAVGILAQRIGSRKREVWVLAPNQKGKLNIRFAKCGESKNCANFHDKV